MPTDSPRRSGGSREQSTSSAAGWQAVPSNSHPSPRKSSKPLIKFAIRSTTSSLHLSSSNKTVSNTPPSSSSSSSSSNKEVRPPNKATGWVSIKNQTNGGGGGSGGGGSSSVSVSKLVEGNKKRTSRTSDTTVHPDSRARLSKTAQPPHPKRPNIPSLLGPLPQLTPSSYGTGPHLSQGGLLPNQPYHQHMEEGRSGLLGPYPMARQSSGKWWVKISA